MDQTATEHAETSPATPVRNDASLSIPSLLFENTTPFASLQFDTIDQHGFAFHVAVAKARYSIGPCRGDGTAELTLLDGSARLNAEDIHCDGNPEASVLEESDLAPFKPKCDVIVNAVAYSPGGKPAKEFEASLQLAVREPIPGTTRKLIDKSLRVCGPRWLMKKSALRRLPEFALTIATLGLVRPLPWRLSKPQPASHLPLRYEHATGGQCRINWDSPAAKRVPKKYRLPSTDAAHVTAAVAHEACQTNPVGKGFVRAWYLQAERCRRFPAPQLGYRGKDYTARDFLASAKGRALPPPAGFGVIGRAWLPRRLAIGSIEEKASWQPDEVPRLPPDFDHAYWNAAPADQQCDYLRGAEHFTLVNLCSPEHESAWKDERGDTRLRFDLPAQAVFLLVLDQQSNASVLSLALDTVVINPEISRVDLVWRAALPADGTLTRARLMRVTERAQIERLHLASSTEATGDAAQQQ